MDANAADTMMQERRTSSSQTTSQTVDDTLPYKMGKLTLSMAQREGKEAVWEGKVTSGDPAGPECTITTYSTDKAFH